MCKSIEGVNGKTGMALDWIRWVAQVAVLPAFIGLFGWTVVHDRDLATIKANRYTSEDHMAHLEQANAQMVTIFQELASLRVAMAELPPRAFVERVDILADRLRAMELELAKQR